MWKYMDVNPIDMDVIGILGTHPERKRYLQVNAAS